jgi:hypothetical protein
MTLAALTLDRMVEHADQLEGVRRADLRRGDCVVVETRNSSYSICALGDEQYWVSGGWFDRQGMSPATVTISGCTWGGSAIKTDLVAAPGLCLEFGCRVVTSRIRGVRIIRAEETGTQH